MEENKKENQELDVKPSDADASGEKPKNRKKPKFSGAYWYIAIEDENLSRLSFTRSLLSIIAFMLQLVVLLLPQEGLAYVTYQIPSYAYCYMWAVFIMIAVAIFAIVMGFTRNKLKKRIPVEQAPKKGFKFFTFFSTELFTVMLLIIFGMELSFVCLNYDGFGLLGMFLSLASLGVQVWSRMIAHSVLKTAELVPAPEE